MEEQGDEDDGVSVDSDEHGDESAEEVAWDFTTFKIPVIEVRLLRKLSSTCVPSAILRNNLVWLMLRPLLKTEYLPSLGLLSSLIFEPK